MIRPRLLRLLVFILSLSIIASVALAQAQTNKDYEPTESQGGKDVIWLPTSQHLVEKMLDLAKLTPQDYLIDLGSGDGRTVITAAKRGARALGIEYNPDMVGFANRNAEKAGVSDKAQFAQGDLYEADLSKATVITMFLLPEINMKLRPKLLDLKPGTRIVTNSFTMGDWEEDGTDNVEEGPNCRTYCTAYLWIVPAKVEGVWKLPQGEITLKQTFQMLKGSLKSGTKDASISKGRVNGDQIIFMAGDARYVGRIMGDTMQGTVTSGGKTVQWTATRVGGMAKATK
jgi:SAM-dependent methyltransferase